ncbi:MAG: hypothetical protein LUE25_02160 [Clostridiales bacterium]|nr:hypothetical protein [Clostridiales bacterium]
MNKSSDDNPMWFDVPDINHDGKIDPVERELEYDLFELEEDEGSHALSDDDEFIWDINELDDDDGDEDDDGGDIWGIDELDNDDDDEDNDDDGDDDIWDIDEHDDDDDDDAGDKPFSVAVKVTLGGSTENDTSGHDTIPISFSLPFRFTGYESSLLLRKSDFPNERTYDAAIALCALNQGTAYISESRNHDTEIEKCKMILYPETIAAKYLTVDYGFLYAQAVKENFALPIDVPDEDKHPVTSFYNLFIELAEEDTALAVKTWVWCVKEFGPYKEYMKGKMELYYRIISNSRDFPPEFMDLAVAEMSENPEFRRGVLTENTEFSCPFRYVAHALKKGDFDAAEAIYRDAVEFPDVKGTSLEYFIDKIISECYSPDGLETMEAFKFHILPIIALSENKRIQRLYPEFEKRVNDHIRFAETSLEKYQYSRRFSWRRDCPDGSKYGLNPLNFETDEEYRSALLNRKYGWRTWRWNIDGAEKYGLDVTAYETHEEFVAALDEKRRQAREADAVKRAKEKAEEKRRQAASDPKSETDMTVYTFCGVMFAGGNTVYHYRTDDDSIDIGDMVIVPVGEDERELAAEVVSVERHRRKTAPYPVDRAKFILRRKEKEDAK